MGDVMKQAAFSLAEAKFTTGDINHMVLQNVTKAQIKVKSKKDNVAGKGYLVSLSTTNNLSKIIYFLFILGIENIEKKYSNQ